MTVPDFRSRFCAPVPDFHFILTVPFHIPKSFHSIPGFSNGFGLVQRHDVIYMYLSLQKCSILSNQLCSLLQH